MRQDVGVDGDAQRISQLCWMFFLKILDDQDAEFELMDREYSSPIPNELRWASWAANPEGVTGDELLGSSTTRSSRGSRASLHPVRRHPASALSEMCLRMRTTT
jgi:hypothetical protein